MRRLSSPVFRRNSATAMLCGRGAFRPCVVEAHRASIGDPDLLRLLTIRLKANGYDVTAVESGQRALASIAAARPDLVLTDLRMDGMDGMDLLGRLRAEFPEIPVVMLTAHGSIEVAVEAMRHGAFDFLTKPFDKDRVVERYRALAKAGW